jgi:hypothetical protein
MSADPWDVMLAESASDGMALLNTIRIALGQADKLPAAQREEVLWLLYQMFLPRWDRVMRDGESLDAAFDWTPPNARTRYKAKHGFEAAKLAAQLIREGWTTDPASERYAFQEVAIRLRLSVAPSWVRDRYYECFPASTRE